MVQNKALIFADYPTGLPEVGKHLKIEARDFDVDQAPPAGGLTAKVHYVSFDPYQRGRMRRPEIKSYAPPFELGKPITNALETHVEETAVKFDQSVTDELILSYVRTREGADKAGGYGIQGVGSILVEKIDGTFDNVVGLPLRATLMLIEKVIAEPATMETVDHVL